MCLFSLGTRYSFATRNVIKSDTTVKFEGKRHNCLMQNVNRHVVMCRSHSAKNVVTAACVTDKYPINRTQESVTNLVEYALNAMDVLFRFSRPYAAIATVGL